MYKATIFYVPVTKYFYGNDSNEYFYFLYFYSMLTVPYQLYEYLAIIFASRLNLKYFTSILDIELMQTLRITCANFFTNLLQ